MSTKEIDINCDMGESYGRWRMGHDAEMMPSITSANVACGAHAGDSDVMLATVRLARRFGVAVGAHPGYFDLRGFGRHPLSLLPDEVTALVLYQVGALWAICRSEGAELRHVKPHGALYNQACVDPKLARVVATAVKRFSAEVALFGLPCSELERAAAEEGLDFIAEGFADRAYEPSGLLRDRKHPDSLLLDPERASEQAVQLASGHVTTVDGSIMKLGVRTICIHGDTPGAPRIAAAIRQGLELAGFKLSAATGTDRSGG